jgi:hypothetical protein
MQHYFCLITSKVMMLQELLQHAATMRNNDLVPEAGTEYR